MEEKDSDLYIGFSVIDMAQWLHQINILTPFIFRINIIFARTHFCHRHMENSRIFEL